MVMCLISLLNSYQVLEKSGLFDKLNAFSQSLKGDQHHLLAQMLPLRKFWLVFSFFLMFATIGISKLPSWISMTECEALNQRYQRGPYLWKGLLFNITLDYYCPAHMGWCSDETMSQQSVISGFISIALNRISKSPLS